MFPWNIAKSAEALFSRWAIKRVCQFLLKKKLGKFILGEIDLKQLDVQLSAGTLQLSDLALNVDYLNQKLGAAAVVVKEGSIGSLLVSMPWKGNGCQIELDEVELVIVPCGKNVSQEGPKPRHSSKCDNYPANHDLEKLDHNAATSSGMLTSLDVHEGVKTIAEMLKGLLSSFRVKIKKLIVAFDASVVEEKNERLCSTLVLRIAEAECGTRISGEDAHLSQLTSFLKFQGAVLEFLQMDGVEHQKPIPCPSETTSGEWLSGLCRPTAMTPIITGNNGGFSGQLKLSIPWKSGSLDIRRVDADANIDPLELRFQPRTLTCFMYLWNIFKVNSTLNEDQMIYNAAEPIYNNIQENYDSSAPGPCVFNADMSTENHCSVVSRCSLTVEESKMGVLLSDSNFISDWVGRSHRDGTSVEPDFGPSVDQFFECFDELRSSQTALGNSGVWNWTCSVFSAITAASNLASGSLHVQNEQQHVETELKMTVAQISLLFSLVDEDPAHSCGGMNDQAKADSDVHYLSAKFNSLLLVLQVCPREVHFQATVDHIALDDHFSPHDEGIDPKWHSKSDEVRIQADITQKMQDGVNDALAPFHSPSEDVGNDADAHMNVDSKGSSCSTANTEGIYRDDVVKVNLLKTLGISCCQVSVNYRTSDNIFKGPTSFTLELPQFILWVNFGLIDMVLDLLKQIRSSEISSRMNDSAPEALASKSMSDSLGREGKHTLSDALSISTDEGLRGNIFLSNARIILCFPYEKAEDSEGYSFFEQFIAMDFSSPPSLGHRRDEAAKTMPTTSSRKGCMQANSTSLHLSLGDLNAYLVSSDTKENGRSELCSMVRLKFFAQKILSVDGFSVISMSWQEGASTGSWITEKAKMLATGENLRGRVKGEGYEFVSVTAEDMEDFDTLQEINSGSGFFLHARISPTVINLEKIQYDNLIFLLHQLSGLSCMASDPVNEAFPFQGSTLVECDSVVISTSMEVVDGVKGSIQRELPGCWHGFELRMQKFQFLSVSNIGGTRDASFLWVAHSEGNLLGSVSGVPHEELLLISCSNSTMGRGDGEGLNIISPGFSGSNIVHLWHPEDSYSYTLITLRCATVIALGGRLDWWDAVSSFFSIPSSELEPDNEKSLQKEDSQRSSPCRSSFVLNLVDVALSYEPYLYGYVGHEGSGMGSCSATVNDAMDDPYFACILAASSFRLSSTSVFNSSAREYKIGVRDLGLLLSPVHGPKIVCGTYDVKHLRMVGYVKVAQEEHFEALLRTSSEQDIVWEVESSDSNIVLSTCCDTTAGLIRLCGQLQQLFAPDMEDALVHLQTRWNNSKRVNEDIVNRTFTGDASASAPMFSDLDTNAKPCMGNLMDEIYEGAFRLDGTSDDQGDYCDENLHMSFNESFLGKPTNISTRNGEKCPGYLSFAGSMPVVELENSGTSIQLQNIPEYKEEYLLSDPFPLSEPFPKGQQSDDTLECKDGSINFEEAGTRNSGWYRDSSLRIFENHVSQVSEEANVSQLEDWEACSRNTEADDYGRIKGRVILKNMKVVWRMYAGSDWRNFQKAVKHSAVTSGREKTVCLEISLSGMKTQYDIFPDGGISVSRLAITIQDFCLNDNSKDAPWKLVLGYYPSKDHPRKSSSKALNLDLESVRPDPSIPLEEYRLRVAFLPMRVHLHQKQLDFLINFFGGGCSSVDSSQSAAQDLPEVGKEAKKSSNLRGHMVVEEALLPYFQKFDMWPVLIQVDYRPHHVDLAALSSGKYVELVNLVRWKGVELELKHVNAVGVYGWSCVCETIIGEWLEDISKNQIHKLFKGLPPIGSLVAVGSGAAKLVTLPVKNYRKDRKLLKGMQRGTIAFLRSISLQAIGLGVHLAAGAHDVLLQAEYILTSIPPTLSWSPQGRGNINVRSNQPKDARQGIKKAYDSISDGLGKAASALVRTPLNRYQRGAGVGSALATAVQAAPAAAIAPASATARAMHYALLGVRNSLDPERKKESLDKYLGATQHQEYM